MKFLKGLGWLAVPYLMLPFQWKKIGKVGKTLGSIWALIALIVVFTDPPEQDPATIPVASQEVAATNEQKELDKPKEEVTKEEVSKQVEPKNKPTTAHANQETVAQDKVEFAQITPEGGLGDTLDTFKEKYGDNSGDDMMARFKDDYILPMFLENRAWNIHVQFEMTNQPRRNKQEALASVKGMVPADSNLVREYQDDILWVMEYHSDTLAKAFDSTSSDAKKAFWGEANPGTFMIILGQDIDNPQLYHSAVIGTGDSP